MPPKLIIFDVCNTLYDSNTTFEFIRFVLQKKYPGRLRLLDLLSQKFSPLFIGLTLLGKYQNKDVVRNRAVRLLTGISKEELLTLADEFYQTHLRAKEIGDVLQLLQEHQQQHEVWLFSNSIDPVIQTIAKHLQVDYKASELEYDSHDIFTGKFKRDLSGKKQEAFLEVFKDKRSIAMMCSDNKSDLEILKLAEQPIVVIYKPSDKKFWQSLNPVFIEKF